MTWSLSDVESIEGWKARTTERLSSGGFFFVLRTFERKRLNGSHSWQRFFLEYVAHLERLCTIVFTSRRGCQRGWNLHAISRALYFANYFCVYLYLIRGPLDSELHYRAPAIRRELTIGIR
jgi:hypothetical protein